MPSANTGDVIRDVKIKKNKVEVYFQDGSSLLLSPDLYSDYFLYVGKELTAKEKKELTKRAKRQKERDYATAYALKGLKSQKEVRDALLRKGSGYADAASISEELVREGLIDEEALGDYLVDSYTQRGYGERYIQEKLYLKGLKKREVEADEEVLGNLFQRLLSKYADVPLRKRKEKITAFLLRRGYSNEDFASLVKEISNAPEQEEKERKMCRLALKTLMEKEREGYNQRALRQKAYARLMAMGYDPDDIARALEDSNDETNC